MNRLKVDMPLFRGKCLDNNEWVYGSLLTFKDAVDGYSHIIVPQKDANLFSDGEGYKESDLGVEVWYRVDPETVGQYTGLKNKNGAKIFEGDITHHHRHGEITYWVWHKRHICYVGKPLDVESDDRYYYQELDIPYLEVLGNIHDNPELLEVE